MIVNKGIHTYKANTERNIIGKKHHAQGLLQHGGGHTWQSSRLALGLERREWECSYLL